MSMIEISDPKGTTSLEASVNRLLPDRHALKMVCLYEEAQTRIWTRAVANQVQTIMGRRELQVGWWKIADLQYPGVMAGAVSKAMRADLIVVGSRGAEGLPVPFYFWVNNWLPHRPTKTGILLGLLSSQEPYTRGSGRLHEYLRMMAQKAGLELVMEQRSLAEPVFDRRVRIWN